MCGKWHLGTREYLPTAHGFDTYFGAPMTPNECYSNIRTPGSTTPSGPFGPCPLFNGSSGKVWRQSNGTYPADPAAVDMLEVRSGDRNRETEKDRQMDRWTDGQRVDEKDSECAATEKRENPCNR
jgi:hypothetical protein